jgi:hypothetical protein
MEAYHKRNAPAAVGLPFFSGALRQSRKTMLRKSGTQEADRIHKIERCRELQLDWHYRLSADF